MSNNSSDLFTGDGSIDKVKVRGEMTWQMVKGAGVAFGIFFGSWIFVAVLAWMGTFLPPESKEAVDPSPDSFSRIDAGYIAPEPMDN